MQEETLRERTMFSKGLSDVQQEVCNFEGLIKTEMANLKMKNYEFKLEMKRLINRLMVWNSFLTIILIIVVITILSK